jgi:hypothetical protein
MASTVGQFEVCVFLSVIVKDKYPITDTPRADGG